MIAFYQEYPDPMAILPQAAAQMTSSPEVPQPVALLPEPQSDLAQQTLKDPYIFDCLTLAEPFHERELETVLVGHLEKFLLELGQGFAFVGRQYRLDVGAAAGGGDRGRAGAEAGEDMRRLAATRCESQAGTAKLDAAIAANLKELGYGG